MANYKTVELTKIASRTTGEIETQCTLDHNISTLENGAIMFINAEKDSVVSTYTAATCIDAMYLHFSNPRRYEDGKSGMENFIYENSEDVLPRLYKLTTGDLFTTDFTYSALTFGNHEIVAVKETTMPNGKVGTLYRVIK